MPLQIYPPNRSTMRLIFQLALSTCTLPGATKEIKDASNYYEYLWNAQEEQEARKEKPTPAPDESAVAKHGINSPEAQGVRDARTAARKTAEAEKKKPNVKKKGATETTPDNTSP